MRVGSLFSGIGGMDLGLERAGMTVAWQSEIDPYCCKVLAKHWPDVPNLGDVTQIEWSEVERVDLICGGYPCQPFSFAGDRGGSSDPRHLWPFMFDAICRLQPRYVLAENVPGHLSLGLDQVLADLASIGFDAEWSTVSACAMGAPHARERVFWLAYPEGGHVAYHLPSDRRLAAGSGQPRGSRRSTRGDGWLPEPAMDRVAHGLPLRVVRDPLRALGNAVVPQVAEWIGTQLLEHVKAAA